MRVPHAMILSALAAGCARHNGPEGPARAEASCTSTDGVGVEFQFGLESEGCEAGLSEDGWLRIAVWESAWDGLSAATYEIASDDGEESGGVWYAADGGEWVGGGGWIEITSLGEGSASGRYEITTDEGEVVGDAFEDLPWCDGSPGCG